MCVYGGVWKGYGVKPSRQDRLTQMKMCLWEGKKPTVTIEIASSNCRMNRETAADAPSIKIIGSLSLSTNRFQIGSFSADASSFSPLNFCRWATSSVLETVGGKCTKMCKEKILEIYHQNGETRTLGPTLDQLMLVVRHPQWKGVRLYKIRSWYLDKFTAA